MDGSPEKAQDTPSDTSTPLPKVTAVKCVRFFPAELDPPKGNILCFHDNQTVTTF